MGSPLSHWHHTQGDTSTALEGPQQGSSRDQDQVHHRIWDQDWLGAKSFGPGGGLFTGARPPFVTDGGWW